ncbi:hypothetical protein [Bacillus pumilus]|uniref:hypothetical protein n=1 Tax=Bacillus pumilus TaxID=1408 RepID=UPI00119D9F3F|nr:hypothetical protein [Bacillus pumilus]
MTQINIPITSFIKFAFSQNGLARTKCVREIKQQIEQQYNPHFDYWKKLRESIVKLHKGTISIEEFHSIPLQIPEESKRRNYLIAVNNYIRLIKNKNVEYFETGKSYWNYRDELLVNSSPTIGLYIDKVPHLIRLAPRKSKDREDKRRVFTALTLMSESQKNYVPPTDSINAILNPVKSKLYLESPHNDDLLIALESDAAAFCATWQRV